MGNNKIMNNRSRVTSLLGLVCLSGVTDTAGFSEISESGLSSVQLHMKEYVYRFQVEGSPEKVQILNEKK